MDSGNSASMQSSSGGDEEYDSRTESISSFLNSSAHFGSISEPAQQQQPPPPLLSHQPTLFRHPHSQNLDGFPQSLANPSGNNAQYAHDVLWSRGLRSDPSNYVNFGNITALSASSTSSSAQSVLNVQGLNQSLPPQSSIDANNAATKASVLQSDHQPNPVKNPKKRTRASRRAPTTVLTTDTTNFRQMVQEFTGIPTAPFSAGSPYSRRFDLFSTGTSNLRSASHLDALGPLYPLRPSAQKVHQLSPSSLLNSPAMVDSLVSSTTNSGNTVMPSPQQILNMQNQMLSFQGNNTATATTATNSSATNANNNNNNNPSIPSFLQLPSLNHHPSSSSSAMLTGKSSQGINPSIPSFDDLGLGHHENVNVNASLNSGLFPTSSERWRGGGGSAAALNDHHNLGSSSFDGGNKTQHLSNNYSKFNCSGSTSEFLHHDKGLENVSSGGEGTVGSWICPSD